MHGASLTGTGLQTRICDGAAPNIHLSTCVTKCSMASWRDLPTPSATPVRGWQAPRHSASSGHERPDGLSIPPATASGLAATGAPEAQSPGPSVYASAHVHALHGYQHDARSNGELLLQYKVASATAEQLGAKVRVLQQQLASHSQTEQQLKAEYQSVIAQLQATVAAQEHQLQQEREARASLESELQALRRRSDEQAQQVDVLADKGQRLEAERWEAVEAMSEMAANLVLYEKERAEIERLRVELKQQRNEVDVTRRALEQQQRRQASAASGTALAADEVQGVQEQFAELERAMVSVEQALTTRAMFRHGTVLEEAAAASAMAGSFSPAAHALLGQQAGQAGRPSRALAATAAIADAGCEHTATLRGLARAAREHLSRALAVGGGDGQDAVSPSAADVARHLREQHRALLRLVQLLASDAEADAAALLQKEAAAAALAHKVAALQREALALGSQAANVPRLQEHNEALAREAEAMRDAAKTVKGRLRDQLEALLAQNKTLRWGACRPAIRLLRQRWCSLRGF